MLVLKAAIDLTCSEIAYIIPLLCWRYDDSVDEPVGVQKARVFWQSSSILNK